MTRLLACLIAVLMLGAAAPAPFQAQWAWDHVARVVVMGDLHGDYAKFHDQLTQAGLINDKDQWSGGQTHLVQLGDVPDRAPDTCNRCFSTRAMAGKEQVWGKFALSKVERLSVRYLKKRQVIYLTLKSLT